jgi:hypothetical protein
MFPSLMDEKLVLQSWRVGRARISKNEFRRMLGIGERSQQHLGNAVIFVGLPMLATNGPGFALARWTPLEGDTQG